MTDSPSGWLRSLAAEATPVDPHGPWHEADRAREKLEDMVLDLAVLCADAIDALEYVLGYDVAGWDAHMDSPHLLNPKLRDLLARFAALQPDNTEEEQT